MAPATAEPAPRSVSRYRHLGASAFGLVGRTRLVDCNERSDSCERELEACTEQRFGLNQQDDQRSHCEISHGQRVTIEDDGDEHDQRHGERALRADP